MDELLTLLCILYGYNTVGLLLFYAVLVLAYVAGIGLFAHKVWLTISKGGPMHEVRAYLQYNYVVECCCLIGAEDAVYCDCFARNVHYSCAHTSLEVLSEWMGHTSV